MAISAVALAKTRTARGAVSRWRSVPATPSKRRDSAVFAFISGWPGNSLVRKGIPMNQPSKPTAPTAAPIRQRSATQTAGSAAQQRASSEACDAPRAVAAVAAFIEPPQRSTPHVHGEAPAGSAAAAPTPGSCTMNAVPSPIPLSARTVPPWASTMTRTT